jgi:alanyl-tRNA synthetase
MDSRTLRQRFLDVMRSEGHALIGAAPLVPENDPSVLFTTAGMHPLVPYLLGAPHPAGSRLANSQPCLRTVDIAEVGDLTHLTLFEMLGNWSLGDYGRVGAIKLSHRLLTQAFGHDPALLHVTCFAGDETAPRDEEAAAAWRALGIADERIHFLPREDNWWGPVGAGGPCGPDSEVFVDLRPDGPPGEHPGNTPARFAEIANNVFMVYDQQPDGALRPLARPCIDVGVGLERNLMTLTGAASVYETDLFAPIIAAIRALATRRDDFAERVVADHARAAVFLLAEGVTPGKADQPYIVRRLIRRAARYGRALGIGGPLLPRLVGPVAATLGDDYPLLRERAAAVEAALGEEEERFGRTLARGERVLAQAISASREADESSLSAEVAFRLYDTFGFPLELTAELAAREGLGVDEAGFAAAFAAHQERSRAGAAARFAGGLVERNPATTQLHTATHLLHAALRRVLGPHVEQRGSNITVERLRFDFSHGERLGPEELAAVEGWVNEQIGADLPIAWEELSLDEARARGAIGLFGGRYGERVRIYQIGDVSLEICGGPHVDRTGELGRLRIVKEEAVGAGTRRIRAVLEETAAG